MKNNTAFIRTTEVSYGFGEHVVVNHLSLAFEKGVSYALIGQSGIGKTTLLRLLAGFTQQESGSIYINHEKLIKPRSKTGFLFQDFGLFPWQTVFESVKMPLQMHSSRQKEELESHVLEWLRELQIEHCRDKRE